MENFWHDHPLYLRRLIGERSWLFLVLHVIVAYVALAIVLPVSGAINMAGLESWGIVGFALSAVAVLLLLLVGYLLFFLPVRVLGGDNLLAYFCILLSPMLSWNLLY